MAEQSTHASHPQLGENSSPAEAARGPSPSEPHVSGAGANGSSLHLSSESPSPEVVEPGNGNAESASATPIPAVLVSPEQQKTVISRNRPEGSSSVPPPSNPLEMAVVLEGQRLGHFELGQFVGGGGMGAVFRASDTMLDRTVAVKILSRHHTDDEIIRRFKNEAQSAARLDHPNIARVYYVGEDQGWNYIVFEFIEGVNIRDLVESKGPLSLEEAFSYTLQIAEALEHACSRDVVHRDIKPSNVLVMPDGRAKLVDMGLARLHQVEAADNDLTASGVTLGTFDYISPEQARDPRSADVRSDLYSLGCTMYYMLTGRPPFAGTAIKKLLSHAGDAPPDVRETRPDVPEEVVAMVNKMMAKRPEARYQKPSELIGELLLLAEHLGLTGATQGGTVWITRENTSSAWERFAPAIVSVASILLLLVGVLALDHFVSRRDAVPISIARPVLERPPVPESSPPSGPGSTLPSEIENSVGSESSPDSGATDSTSSDSPDVALGATPAASAADDDGPELATSEKDPLPSEGPRAPNVLDEILGPMPPGGMTLAEASRNELTLRPTIDEVALLDGSSEDSDALLSVAEPLEAPAEPRAAPTPPEILLVGVPPAVLPAGTIAFESLEAALRYAAETPTVREITVAGGTHAVQPVDLTMKAVNKRRQLTVRAQGGAETVLLFRPEPDEFGDLPTQMLNVVGGRDIELRFEDIHFRLELPTEVAEQWSDRWSLFRLQSLSALALSSCTMTIQNVGADGRALHEKVAFVEIEPPLAAEDSPKTRPFLDLENCIARGQATLVRTETATPFSLSWNQGLFVTTERLIEMGGAAKDPGKDQVELLLDHITAVLPKGMCLLETDSAKQYQLRLELDCNNSIIITDPEAPLLTREGPESPEEALQKLKVVAAVNYYYPQEPIFCRVGNDLGETKTFSFDEIADKFSSVDSPKDQEFVMWDTEPMLDAPAHRQRKQNFQLSDTPHSALEREAGFNAAALPEAPPTAEDLSSPPAAPSSSTPPMPREASEPPAMPAMPNMSNTPETVMPEMPSPPGASSAEDSSPPGALPGAN